MLRNGRSWWPGAYANLLKLKDRHPYRATVQGAGALFQHLLP